MKILVSGYGQMGKLLVETIQNHQEFTCVGVVDPLGKTDFQSFKQVNDIPDVLIDFSHPSLLGEILAFATKNKVPIVLATTHYSIEDETQIQEASQIIPIFKTANLSFGIQVLLKACELLREYLPDSDIEIVETHHRQKIDAPSGTAKMILNQLRDDDSVVYYGRLGEKKREKHDIGVHSLRGGTVNGIHEVQFLMDHEVITIQHQAESKGVFVNGALKASRFLVSQKPGLYDMKDLMED